MFPALTLNQSKKPGGGCSHFFFLAGFVFTATTALAVVRLSPLFAEVSFSFPLDPLCWRVFRYFHILATASGDLFSAWRSGHPAAFLCCLEPRIVLFVFSLISEDIWRVMWLFIVRHVTCRCGKKHSHCVKTFCDKNVFCLFFFYKIDMPTFFLFAVSRLMEANLPSVLFCLFTRKALMETVLNDKQEQKYGLMKQEMTRDAGVLFICWDKTEK